LTAIEIVAMKVLETTPDQGGAGSLHGPQASYPRASMYRMTTALAAASSPETGRALRSGDPAGRAAVNSRT
jgi:hypothetical protein